MTYYKYNKYMICRNNIKEAFQDLVRLVSDSQSPEYTDVQPDEVAFWKGKGDFDLFYDLCKKFVAEVEDIENQLLEQDIQKNKLEGLE